MYEYDTVSLRHTRRMSTNSDIFGSGGARERERRREREIKIEGRQHVAGSETSRCTFTAM